MDNSEKAAIGIELLGAFLDYVAARAKARQLGVINKPVSGNENLIEGKAALEELTRADAAIRTAVCNALAAADAGQA